MNTAFTSFLNWFVETIPSVLMREPFIYFVGIALLCFTVKIILTIVGRRS